MSNMAANLFEKTELFVRPITLQSANLTDIALAVSRTLGLRANEVSVIDVREGILALDVLRAQVDIENIIGKEDDIISALNNIRGITVYPDTAVHSEGVLGNVSLKGVDPKRIARRSAQIIDSVEKTVSRRVMIFPTGTEIINGYIQDTNSPFLARLMRDEGYDVTIGPPLEDSQHVVIDRFNHAIDRGFGVVITTGGVGAEDKDFIVESILTLDPFAAAPYIVHYQKGRGRHTKDGVRIAVGKVAYTLFIALPGPHDEVQMASPILINGLKSGLPVSRLAENLSKPIREKLMIQHTQYLH